MFKIKNSLTAIYEKLNHDYFIIPHRSFIINIRYIREIDGKSKNIVMKNNDLIFIARGKYNIIIDALSNYIVDEEV